MLFCGCVVYDFMSIQIRLTTQSSPKSTKANREICESSRPLPSLEPEFPWWICLCIGRLGRRYFRLLASLHPNSLVGAKSGSNSRCRVSKPEKYARTYPPYQNHARCESERRVKRLGWSGWLMMGMECWWLKPHGLSLRPSAVYGGKYPNGK